MNGKMVEFRVNGRKGTGYLSVPAGGKGPGLILIQEWWGLVDHIKAMADRFAGVGYVTLAPDLYHGQTTKSPDEAGKLLMALNIAEAGKDMKGAADYLLASDAVTSKKVGIMGFCMGGQLAVYAGMEYPNEIAAVVDYYGIHPKVEIDPTRVHVPILGHFGKQDTSVPEERVRALADSINAAGGSMVYHYYDAQHAFCNDTRPQVYSPRDAEAAWKRTVEFLGKNVR